MKIVFTCPNCHYMNRQYMGTKGYEFRQSTFDFAEAVKHVMENQDHDVQAELEETE